SEEPQPVRAANAVARQASERSRRVRATVMVAALYWSALDRPTAAVGVVTAVPSRCCAASHAGAGFFEPSAFIAGVCKSADTEADLTRPFLYNTRLSVAPSPQ